MKKIDALAFFKAKGVTQRGIAKILGITQSAVSKWGEGTDAEHEKLVPYICAIKLSRMYPELKLDDSLYERRQNYGPKVGDGEAA